MLLMKKIVLFCCLLGSTTAFAQSFIPAFDRFSGKEIAYITLEDGTEIEGTIDDIDRKKGLIEEVVLLPKGEKKKRKIKAEEIKHMYLPASGYNKLVNASEQGFNAQKWKDNNVNMEIINKGYAYFEKSTVGIKRDIETLLMQMVNPSFSQKIKVYHDPRAQESMRFGVAGITMAGGDDKSYYVKVGDATAVKIKRADYDKAYLALYKDCPDLLKKIKDDHRWSKFDEHLWAYTTECK